MRGQGQAEAAGHKPIAMVSSGQEAVDWSQYGDELKNWQVQVRMSVSLVDHYRRLGCMNLSSKMQGECRNGHHEVDNMSFKTSGTAINEQSPV